MLLWNALKWLAPQSWQVLRFTRAILTVLRRPAVAFKPNRADLCRFPAFDAD
jgi:hypothetical protein